VSDLVHVCEHGLVIEHDEECGDCALADETRRRIRSTQGPAAEPCAECERLRQRNANQLSDAARHAAEMEGLRHHFRVLADAYDKHRQRADRAEAALAAVCDEWSPATSIAGERMRDIARRALGRGEP
jgi:hypothetical protein